MLPIPELEPFRLSRQMRGVLAPHDALAVLGAPMAAALHALRGGANILEVRGHLRLSVPARLELSFTHCEKVIISHLFLTV